MYFRQLLNDETACASYLLGCKTHGAFAVVEPHIDVVDEYVALAASQGASIVAVLDTHMQADHVSGLPELVARTGATAYLPEGTGVEFAHQPLTDRLPAGDAGRTHEVAGSMASPWKRTRSSSVPVASGKPTQTGEGLSRPRLG